MSKNFLDQTQDQERDQTQDRQHVASRLKQAAYDAYYYRDAFGVPCGPVEPWLTHYATIADRIVREVAPATVLDAGCGMGLLVAALRARGVDAYGIDFSRFAIEHVPDSVKPFCHVGDVRQPFDRQYDLVTSLEVLEHLPASEADSAVANLCAGAGGGAVLFSSTPDDLADSTHLNVRPREYWVELFAAHDFLLEPEVDPAFYIPWAMLLRRRSRPWHQTLAPYERRLSALTRERDALRERALVHETEISALKARLERVAEAEAASDTVSRELAEQRDELEALTARLSYMSDRESEQRRLLLDAHEQLILRDQQFIVQQHGSSPLPALDWQQELSAQTAWVHVLQGEVARRDEIIVELQRQVAEQTAWAQRLDSEIAQRDEIIAELQGQLAEQTAWAQQVDIELAEQKAKAQQVDIELAEQKAKAQQLNGEVAQRDGVVIELRRQVAEQTAWAQRLDSEVAQRDQVIRQLQREVSLGTAAQLHRRLSGRKGVDGRP